MQVASLSKESIMELGRSNLIPVRKDQWDKLRELYAKMNGNRTIPGSDEIVSIFGSWEGFLIDCGFPDCGFYNSEYVANHLSTPEKIMATSFPKCPLYSGSEKQKIRETMLLTTIDNLPEHDLENARYVGLSGPNFIDYILLHQVTGVNPEKSLTAENWWYAENSMASIIRNWRTIEKGQIFAGLNLFRGYLHEALSNAKFEGMKFNFANFDFIGSWSKEKCDAIQNLFSYGHASDNLVLFVTLNDCEEERKKVWYRKDVNGRKYKKMSEHQVDILKDCVYRTARSHDFHLQEISGRQYNDGTQMIFEGFSIRK